MKRIVFTTLAVILFISLIIIVGVNTYYRSRIVTAQVIHQDIKNLQAIFERIDRECQIKDFDYQHNRINFLNVKAFIGSEVGPMNLIYPDKWQGPYLQDNLAIQGTEYLIVYTQKGYFITPGIGVKLPNNKVVGTDIMLDKQADIMAMTQNTEQLLYEGKELAMPIAIQSFKQVPLEKIPTH